jgi:SagB-type dehydrogenase family enzyme
LDTYLVAGNVEGLAAGVYKYVPKDHQLEVVALGDQREKVGKQPAMTTAPILVVYATDGERLKKLGDKGVTFASIEIGHSAQNVLLEEVALGLVGVGMAGFDENGVKAALNLSDQQTPMYVVSAGKKR